MTSLPPPAPYARMHHDRLDDPEWDRPPVGAEPRRRVIVCSTPRSGSYLLCRQMINAGIGLPTEYLRSRTIETLSRRYGVAAGDDARYLAELESRRTTGNGVFAAKVQWQQFSAHPAVREPWFARADLLIQLRRADTIAQAVSWQVSLATGYWSFDRAPGPRAEDATLADVDQVLDLVRTIGAQNAAWRRVLGGLKRRAIDVLYEDYVRDQSGFLRLVARELGLAADQWREPPPEPRDNRLPDEVEDARAWLLTQARARAAAARR